MMTDSPVLQDIADRAEIGALPGEFTDAAMMRDWDCLASLFTHDCALRMHVEFTKRRSCPARYPCWVGQ
ncbi:MAG: hypothetical protein ABJB47_03730 [Actinomycetota bacterium]